MRRRQADLVVGLLVALVFVLGTALSWQAYQQQRAANRMMESMMGTSMGAAHGPNPLWYVLGTVLVAAVIGGFYLAVRDGIPTEATEEQPRTETRRAVSQSTTDTADAEPASTEIDTEDQPRSRVLDLLPEDERRILDPVLSSPGITQIELRDRADFSKSKVSQTVSALEKRGLLYRERQGRTYRIYPSDSLAQEQN